MGLKVTNGKIRLADGIEDAPPSRLARAQRFFVTHLAVAFLAVVITGGLSLEDKAGAVKDTTDTVQRLATYAGCAEYDQLGNFHWHAFPMKSEDQQEAAAAPKATKTVRRPAPR